MNGETNGGRDDGGIGLIVAGLWKLIERDEVVGVRTGKRCILVS